MISDQLTWRMAICLNKNVRVDLQAKIWRVMVGNKNLDLQAKFTGKNLVCGGVWWAKGWAPMTWPLNETENNIVF